MAEDEVPPLEDMTEYLQSLRKERQEVHGKEQKLSKQPLKTDSSLLGLETKDSSFPPLTSKKLLIVNREDSGNTDAGSDKALNGSGADSKISKSNPKSGSGGFGGMKKGFLFGGERDAKKPQPHKKATPDPVEKGPKQTKTHDIPLIKPLHKSQNDDSAKLQLDEVQEEMKKAYPLLATKDWVTDDLLQKVNENPVLAKAFNDPALTKVLEDFHRDPKGALAAAQSNPEVLKFLQEFCGLMGEHFLSLDSKENKTKDEELITEHLSEEDQRMKDALTKPEVQKVLTDPNIQHLIELLKDRIDEAQRYLESTTDTDFHSKVRLLIEHGVLNIQRK